MSIARLTLALLASVVLAACTSPLRTTIELTRADLQARLERDFPIEERLLIAALRLEDPEIKLDEGADRIGIELTAAVSFGRRAYPGRVGVDGALHYEPDRGEFFLLEPELQRFDVPDLEPSAAKLLRDVTAGALVALLPTIPLYRLDTTPERATKLFIKSVDVRAGRVRIEMGLL